VGTALIGFRFWGSNADGFRCGLVGVECDGNASRGSDEISKCFSAKDHKSHVIVMDETRKLSIFALLIRVTEFVFARDEFAAC
jgi:hypothetical protein